MPSQLASTFMKTMASSLSSTCQTLKQKDNSLKISTKFALNFANEVACIIVFTITVPFRAPYYGNALPPCSKFDQTKGVYLSIITLNQSKKNEFKKYILELFVIYVKLVCVNQPCTVSNIYQSATILKTVHLCIHNCAPN